MTVAPPQYLHANIEVSTEQGVGSGKRFRRQGVLKAIPDTRIHVALPAYEIISADVDSCLSFHVDLCLDLGSRLTLEKIVRNCMPPVSGIVAFGRGARC
jgi:hypothetical protein